MNEDKMLCILLTAIVIAILISGVFKMMQSTNQYTECVKYHSPKECTEK